MKGKLKLDLNQDRGVNSSLPGDTFCYRFKSVQRQISRAATLHGFVGVNAASLWSCFKPQTNLTPQVFCLYAQRFSNKLVML